MSRTKIRIFGVVFAKPKGLRKSPGVNWLASCVREQMTGKSFSSRGAVKVGFSQAAKTCRTKGR